MGLRIWYQSMGRDASWSEYGKHLRRQIETAKRPDTVVEVHGTTKGIAEQYLYLEHLVSRELIDNLHRAMEEKFDAFLIGNFFDPALQICKEISTIPVISLGETSLHFACTIGRDFTIVAPNAKAARRIKENVDHAGLTRRMAGLVDLGTDRILDLGKAFVDAAAREDFCRTLDACAGGTGSGDVVIPGGGVLMALCDRAGFRKTGSGALVLDGVTALVKMGEVAAELGHLWKGAFPAKAGLYATPPGTLLKEIRDLYHPDAYPGAADDR